MLLPQEIHALDASAIQAYNARAKNKFQLHVDMGPSPYEGDIENSPIVLLLANPGFDHTSSLQDHQFAAPGWPLSGLHEQAPIGMRNWWRPRLRTLCADYGDKYIAGRIAALQINPWACANFDSSLRLPSRAKLLGIAEGAAKRGATLIVMRARRLWLESDILRAHPHLYGTKSPRCSYVTERNLGMEAWGKIRDALER